MGSMAQTIIENNKYKNLRNFLNAILENLPYLIHYSEKIYDSEVF